jgi:hypothetical protein
MAFSITTSSIIIIKSKEERVRERERERERKGDIMLSVASLAKKY